MITSSQFAQIRVKKKVLGFIPYTVSIGAAEQASWADKLVAAGLSEAQAIMAVNAIARELERFLERI